MSVRSRRKHYSKHVQEEEVELPVVIETLSDDDTNEEEEYREERRQTKKRRPEALKPSLPASATPPPGPSSNRRTAPPVKQELHAGASLKNRQEQRECHTVSVSPAQITNVEMCIRQLQSDFNEMFERMNGIRFSTQELDFLSSLVIRHFIFKNSEKPGQPIPRNEISSLITGTITDGSGKSRLPGLVIAHARWKLAEGFGLEAKELTKAVAGNKTSRVNDSEGAKYFVLHTIVPPPLFTAFLQQEENKSATDAFRGFVMLILSLIELQGGKVFEDELWNLLAEVGITRNEEHPSLGKIDTLLDEMLKLRYITAGKGMNHRGDDEMGRIIEMGEVALHEFGGIGALKAWYDSEFAAGTQLDAE